MSKDLNNTWVPWVLGVMLTATFSFTSWTAMKVIALEKQTYSYQFGAKAESRALEEKFEAHCVAQTIQDVKIETKVNKTYEKVIQIATKLDIPSD